MMWIAIAIVAGGQLATLALVAWPRLRAEPAPVPRDQLMLERVLERVICTTHTGESFDALLASVDDRSIVLREATVMASDGKRTAVTGELILRRDSISYMQRP